MKTTVVQPAAVRGDTVTVTPRPDEGYEVDEITVADGYGDGRLGPQGQATRAQVAQMLKNKSHIKEQQTL